MTDVAEGDVRVVVHLYRDGRGDCELLQRLLAALAAANPQTKFTRIVYSNAVNDACF